MPSTTTAEQIRSPQSQGWTPARRAAQSAAIRRWSPWKNSTGPRTAAGKAKAAQNAAKPWLKACPERRFKKALSTHARYLAEINRFIALQKIPFKNELLKRVLKNKRRTLKRLGHQSLIELSTALAYAKLCKNLDFYDLLPVKVNANDA